MPMFLVNGRWTWFDVVEENEDGSIRMTDGEGRFYTFTEEDGLRPEDE